MHDEGRIASGAFVAFEAFQVITALETDTGTDAGLKEQLPQCFAKSMSVPDYGRYESKNCEENTRKMDDENKV